MEDYSINISVKKNIQISPMTWQKLSISSFPIISLWELKVAIATRVLIRLKQKTQLEFMFMKHYAPNRCEPSIEALNFFFFFGGGGGGGWGSGQ